MKKTFCIMPWIHIHTRPNGDASPCCVWDINKPIGNINDQPIEKLAHSMNFNLLRKLMLMEKPPKECSDCVDKQLSQVPRTSYRSWQNENFKDHIPELLENTNDDGSLKQEFKMKFLNIRYSNLCNMSCRTCGSHSSSLWAQEEKKSNPVIKITETQPNYLDEIISKLPDAEIINFAGGESILIPEHWKILDKLIELKKTNVKIFYVTNLSKLSYQHKNILDYAKLFPNMRLTGSIDASHQRGELYRNGTNWSHIENNLKEIYKNNVPIRINCTLGAMNIWHAPDLQRYLIESSLIKPDQFSISILTQGKILSTKVLPLKFKQEVVKKIENHKLWLASLNIDSIQWDSVMKFMLSEDHSYLLQELASFNKHLDSVRNQDTLSVFPELASVFNLAPSTGIEPA